MENFINNIIIVGGGSAGWMTATTLLNQFPDKKITLVESPNISNVGVGESTVPNINDWLNMVGINALDFMSQTDAVFKLSIAFENWYRKNSGTFHYPFSFDGKAVALHLNLAAGRETRWGGTSNPSTEQLINRNSKDLYTVGLEDWYYKKVFYPETPVSDFAEWFYPVMTLVNQNKSLFTDNFKAISDRPNLEIDIINNEVQLFSECAYQIDATKFCQWLRDNYCKAKHPNNFTHILAEVKEIPLNDNGIEHLVLDNGQKLEADLFIDCTGFKSLLLTETFNVPFISIENYIPNNYSWATKIPYKDPETQIVNYTNCTAIENGWIWEIPLWSRMGSGYVFSDKFISTEDALKEFKQGLIKKGYENVEELGYHLIPMKTGVQSKLWVKNTCAIGLAAGFVEPLQSNGLHSIHSFIFNLCRTLERGHINEWDRKEFTAVCHQNFYSMASLVALSYTLSHRDDSEYWREIQNRELPPEIFLYDTGGFSRHLLNAWIEKNFFGTNLQASSDMATRCMTTGMNWYPIDIHTLKYRKSNIEDLKKRTEFNIENIEARKSRWKEQVKDFPSPYQYLKNNIHTNGE